MDILDKSKKICLFGVEASLLVAKDAYLKFLRINKNCSVNEDFHSQLVEAKNMKKDDLVIIISYSELTEEMIKFAKVIK